jgi:hypothetical protein
MSPNPLFSEETQIEFLIRLSKFLVSLFLSECREHIMQCETNVAHPVPFAPIRLS